MIYKSRRQTAGVQSTPSYFINGKMVVGIKSLEQELSRLGAAGNSKEQVPFEINGKTYYGCCPNCAAKVVPYSADPLTGETVDKADAYIVLKPDGSNSVFYCKSVETYSKYTANNKVQ